MSKKGQRRRRKAGEGRRRSALGPVARREPARRRELGPSRGPDPGRDPELRRDLPWALGLVALAWLHRILFLESNRDRDWPFSVFYQGDAHTFFLHARALLEGHLYDEGVPFHPPGFPAFLAFLHRLLGAGAAGEAVPHLAVKVVLALISSLSIGLLFLLLRPYLGRTVALATSLLCVWHFGHYVLSVATVSEGLFLTLQLASLLLFSRGLRHPWTAPGAHPARGRRALWVGLCLGVLFGVQALVRAESVLVGFVLGAFGLGSWAFTHREALRRRDLAGGSGRAGDPERPRGGSSRGESSWGESSWGESSQAEPPGPHAPGLAAGAAWLLVAVGFLLVLAPWTVRNHIRMSQLQERMGDQLAEPLPTFVPITIYGPLNLALANRDGADGSFSPEAITGVTGGASLDFRRPDHLRHVLHGDEMAWRWISENPWAFAHLVWRKWGLYLGAFDLGFGQTNWPGGLDGVRRPVDIFVPDSPLARWPWLVLTAVGGVLCLWLPGDARAHRRRWTALAGTVIAAGFLVTVFFFGYARLGLLLLPYTASFVAVALVEGGSRLLRRPPPALDQAPPRTLLATLGALALAILVLDAAGARGDRNFRASASSTVDGHHLNPDDEIRLELIED
ncbi:MAG: glycosyltransferase family 39 protein [Holophagales bacterium]|nr:glycosyltransferase family 39 protein [Holophagales bacterium]